MKAATTSYCSSPSFFKQILSTATISVTTSPFSQLPSTVSSTVQNFILMMGSFKNPSSKKEKKEVLGVSFRPENFIPGLIIGFIFGFFLDLTKLAKTPSGRKIGSSPTTKNQHQPGIVSGSSDEELKMVLVVRQDLKMGSGKIASQCAHAATGMYAELVHSHRSLLRQWELCGQAKIVVTCKNQQEMNKIKDSAEMIGLPTFVVADAGRTQVSAGSKTVLAVGPCLFLASFLNSVVHFLELHPLSFGAGVSQLWIL